MVPWSSLLLLLLLLLVSPFCNFGFAAAAVSGPTAPDMINNKAVKAALNTAWQLSFPDGNLFQERGGWIYADSSNVNKLFVRAAPKDRSKPGKASATGMAIDLENPQGSPGNPAPAGYKVVGNYHTHPLPEGNEQPSTADMINAFLRGVPGIVVSKNAIWYYGPASRDSMGSPQTGYPNTGEQWSGQLPKRFGPNPFPKPRTFTFEENVAAAELAIAEES